MDLNEEELKKLLETNNSYSIALFRQLDLSKGTNVEEFYNDVLRVIGMEGSYYQYIFNNITFGYETAKKVFDNYEIDKMNEYNDIFKSCDF